VISRDGLTTVVQSKRWWNSVGIEAVQQVVGAKLYYGAEGAMVVTNSAYTPAAIELARVTKVTLWDRRVLLEKLRAVNVEELLTIVDEQMAHVRMCPECERLLVKRSGIWGPFYGCSGFPHCRYTRDAT